MLYFDQNAFGKRLQEARRGKQMTQEELADILHVGKLHISRMERGVAACEYYGAAEPLVRCGESHLSGLTEPLRSLV